jgi:2-polyprenyl-3-methyl-5-hydroxy-6-metoxy-1,4-benzoquinol methylase
MRYQSVIDPSNKNNSHSLTIDFIVEGASCESFDILDVGCSAGYLGEYLRAQGHYVIGIDITPEAIAKAVEFLDEAYCMKVEDYFAGNPERKFDVVIFGDVLEHVTNAEEVLRLTALALKPGGRVIASIPNVSHLAVRAMLLEGRWEYSELGLLDRDHVRFFTEKTIYKLFSESGFDLVAMQTTNLPVDVVDRLCNMHLNPYFVELAEKAVGSDPSATVFQYVAMAKPKVFSLRIICMVPETTSGLFQFRVKDPLENLANRYGGMLRFCILGSHSPEDIVWGDVFVFQRHGGAYTLQLMQFLKAHGKRVVFEIDDLLMNLPAFLAHHQGTSESQRLLLAAIACADLVTTTTPRLASQLTKLNPAVICIPNCIKDLPRERVAHSRNGSCDATLIVASSDRVLVDCLVEPLYYLQDKYGESIKLVVIGPIGDFFEREGLRFDAFPILSYAEFAKLLQTLTNPIGLIPLDDSEFSACKSPIKYFDYSVAQIPAICSNAPPYSDYIQNGINGLLVENTSTSWINAIDTLIQSIDERQRLSSAARQYVIDNYLIDKAGDAWKTVIDRLAVERVDIPGLVEALNSRIQPNINIMFIARRLFQPRTYSRLKTIFQSEGISGIKRRLARIIFYS